MREQPARRSARPRRDTALAVAISRNQWELVALLLLDALATTARTMPRGHRRRARVAVAVGGC